MADSTLLQLARRWARHTIRAERATLTWAGIVAGHGLVFLAMAVILQPSTPYLPLLGFFMLFVGWTLFERAGFISLVKIERGKTRQPREGREGGTQSG